MSRLMIPDLASVILTGVLVPIIRKLLNSISYCLVNFSLTTTFSWDMIEFSFVLSSILLKSPSC